jgi:AcrR family transcriptional regulator
MSLKEKIVHESLKLFSLKGFLSTSILDILSASETSKGGFYNHFKTKEDLFYEVLDEARKIWRERNLKGLNEITGSIDKIIKLLVNFRDRYLLDAENFPGGCIFITFAVELGDSRPHLAKEVQKGFVGLKAMIQRLLDEGKDSGEFCNDMNTETITEIIFNAVLGISLNYSADKSFGTLDHSINSLIDFIENLKRKQLH